MSKKPLVDLMLDSGAFSAWNQNTTIDLGSYIDYVHSAEGLLFSHVNLDVLPPRKRVEVKDPRTGKVVRIEWTQESGRGQADVEEGARKSYENLQIMKKEGLAPLPVFHQGENLKWLERMLKDGEPYIGFSARKDLPASVVRTWLDQLFSIVTDVEGRPLIKTHGFGITKPAFLLRYPWYTVDSTTWSLSAGYGKIFVPVYVNGKPDYRQSPINIITSGVTQGNPGAERRQFQGLGPLQQEAVLKFLNEEVGITLEEARYGTTHRRKAILRYYQGLCSHLKDVRFREEHRVSRPFGHAPIDLGKRKGQGGWNLILMYATSLSREWAALMNEVGAHTRLLSYYEMKEKDLAVLREFVTTGIYGEYVKKPPRRRYNSEGYRNFRSLGLVKRLGEPIDEPGRASKKTRDRQPRAR